MPDEPKSSVETNPVAPPVQQWSAQPPAQAQVQYVVAKKSLDGVGGWLMFWLVVFALCGLAYIATFFSVIGQSTFDAKSVLSLVFSVVLAVGFIASVVFIALRKKLGKLISVATIGVATLYAIINTIIISAQSSKSVSSVVGGLVIGAVIGGLAVLYFFVSKRVKETLIN
jgi:hypothetical protein